MIELEYDLMVFYNKQVCRHLACYYEYWALVQKNWNANLTCIEMLTVPS